MPGAGRSSWPIQDTRSGKYLARYAYDALGRRITGWVGWSTDPANRQTLYYYHDGPEAGQTSTLDIIPNFNPQSAFRNPQSRGRHPAVRQRPHLH